MPKTKQAKTKQKKQKKPTPPKREQGFYWLIVTNNNLTVTATVCWWDGERFLGISANNKTVKKIKSKRIIFSADNKLEYAREIPASVLREHSL